MMADYTLLWDATRSLNRPSISLSLGQRVNALQRVINFFPQCHEDYRQFPFNERILL
jgi:hypothetical protein